MAHHDTSRDDSNQIWTAVDEYVEGLLIEPDAALVEALERSRAAGLPAISVSAPLGKLLHLLVRSLRARRVLEIGTLGAYSTIWMARALPRDGRLVTIEADAKHADVARANIARAGLGALVDLRLGKALDVLPEIAREAIGPFDLTFIDADKPSTADYFRWALHVSRAGSVIIVDNVVREGAIRDSASGDLAVRGMRKFLDAVAAEPRVSATVMQTVGSKKYDGFAYILVNE
ncbi:MAG TPA: O-methyltransferase [Vicinamibacterales bacterium]|jgi:predicted O-methyltransferase YrrM